MALQDLINALTSRKTTPLELVEAAIHTIEVHNSKINAVVHPRFEHARKEALKDYSETRFKGIPILIKCLGQDLENEPSTNASKIFADAYATQTSNFVQRIQDLGFIILGQTNAPEFGFKNISDSKLYGDVRMPGNLNYSPGGSSGGSAAALMAHFVPVVAASDGGGSIRIPASYTGCIGLKPTRGSMPVGPSGYRGWQGASINFFLTHTLDDCVMLFDAMSQTQIEAPFTYIKNTKIPKTLNIAYSLESPVGLEVSSEAIAALKQTVKLLKSLGHQLTETAPAINGKRLMETYYQVNGVETAAMVESIQAYTGKVLDREDVELTTWVMYQYGKTLSGSDLVHALNFWDQTSALMHAFHESYDVYLTPTTAFTAPPYDLVYQTESLLEAMRDVENSSNPYQVLWDMFEQSLKRTPYTMLANITGQPALSLPLYKSSDGFYVGSQFMAQKGNEALLFEIGKQLEPWFTTQK